MALLIRGGGMRTSLHLPCAPPIPRAFSFRLPIFSYHQIHHHLDLSIPPFSNPDIDFFLLKKQTLRRRSIAPILAMGYEKELSVAKKAALLAAQLCKVLLFTLSIFKLNFLFFALLLSFENGSELEPVPTACFGLFYLANTLPFLH